MSDAVADDGLPISEIGEWSLEKHDRLRKYVGISRAVRRKFISGAGASYIDLFCGPGRSRIKETGHVVDGSPLVAATAARDGKSEFTNVFVGDTDAACVQACSSRLQSRGVASSYFCGPAEVNATLIAHQLNRNALHFAFLDPFNLGELHFDIIRTFAQFQRMDMLIHVSLQDLQRNLRRYIDQPDGPLDRLAPGWRAAVDARERDELVRKNILEHWLRLIRALNMAPSEGIELVSGSRNQRLYWLVFVARHDLAHQFWNEIRNVTAQRRFDL
jgi:three-Cys-motif partner protein